MINKLVTADIAIHKLLLVSNLYNWITALSRPVHGFESRTRCQIVAAIDGSSFGSQSVAAGAMIFSWRK